MLKEVLASLIAILSESAAAVILSFGGFDFACGPFGSWNDKRSTATLAIRTGYTFTAGLHAIAIEFNGIGPYTYSDGYGTITEIFTQVSFGGRFIF